MIDTQTVIVTCPQGHNFPVNTDKHQDRGYRICPRCGERVYATKKFWRRPEFKPNPKWQEQKAELDRAKRIRKTDRVRVFINPQEWKQNPLWALERAYARMREADEEKQKRFTRVRWGEARKPIKPTKPKI